MKRLHQLLLIGTFVPWCWFGMMAVHELGHVVCAMATGGRIEKVVLYPSTISRTDVVPNPAPLPVVWAGPLVGVILPLGLLLAAKAGRCRWYYMAQFFAGFCLIANGGYIGGGSFHGTENGSDSAVMLANGSSAGWLWLFAVITLALGLYLWNGLGPHFGLGAARGKVDRRAAYASCVLLLLTLALEFTLSPK
jgi:hypothetical protein